MSWNRLIVGSSTNRDIGWSKVAIRLRALCLGRCAQRAWCTGRRDFIREQLPDASAHTIRAGGGPANYLSTRASYIAVSLARIAGRPIGTLGEEVWLCDRLRSPVRAGKAEAGAKFADYFDLSAGSPSNGWASVRRQACIQPRQMVHLSSIQDGFPRRGARVWYDAAREGSVVRIRLPPARSPVQT
jgi:hypothetical protein